MTDEFQYILCCGSTALPTASQSTHFNFNTSYVVVQLEPQGFKACDISDFNTSYVVVQRLIF